MQKLTHSQYVLLHQEYRELIEDATVTLESGHEAIDFENQALANFMICNMQQMNEYIYRTAHKKTKSNAPYKYLITFTHNGEHTVPEFQAACIKQLQRATFCYAEYAFEHLDTNAHCHAIVESRHSINKDNLAAHARKHGFVRVDLVHTDNGIKEYITKENPSIVINKNLAKK